MNSILLATSYSGISFLKPLYWLFGVCMSFLLEILDNKYFIAIIIFTVVTRLLLLPLNVRQQKTMAKTTRLQPKIQKIQKKYPDPKDRGKLNEEMQALYAREGHNPMQMGCGPMLFQMIFLMGIIGIIYYPLSYVMGIDISDVQSEIVELCQQLSGQEKITYAQLDILNNFSIYKEQLIAQYPDLFNAANVDAIESYRSGMVLFGLDMTAIPHWKDGIIVIVPILCLLTSLGSSFVSMRIQKKNNPAAGQQAQQMSLMMYMMPFFSFYIAFKVPAAVGFYWIISNLVAVCQQLFIFKNYPPKKTQARNMIDNTIERRSREKSVKNI